MNRIASAARQEGRRLKVLLACHGTLGFSILRGLLSLKDDVDVVGVFQWSRRTKAERDFDIDEKAMTRFIQQQKIHEVRCPGMNGFEFVQVLETLSPDVVLIGSWGEILKKHVLSLPNIHFINCHPSLLPAHRGAVPYCSVIRMGEQETGVTFHLVDKGIDTGAILKQERVPIYFEDDGGTIKDRCADKAGQMVPELIQSLLSNEGIQPLEQDHAQKSYYPALKLEDGVIYWDDEPWKVYNQVRGLQPWLDCYSFLEGRVFFAFSKLHYHHMAEAIPLEQYPTTPGTVMSVDRGTIWVSSLYTDIVLGISGFKIYVLFFFLPKWLSKLLAPLLFHKGFIVSPYQANYMPPPPPPQEPPTSEAEPSALG